MYCPSKEPLSTNVYKKKCRYSFTLSQQSRRMIAGKTKKMATIAAQGEDEDEKLRIRKTFTHSFTRLVSTGRYGWSL